MRQYVLFIRQDGDVGFLPLVSINPGNLDQIRRVVLCVVVKHAENTEFSMVQSVVFWIVPFFVGCGRGTIACIGRSIEGQFRFGLIMQSVKQTIAEVELLPAEVQVVILSCASVKHLVLQPLSLWPGDAPMTGVYECEYVGLVLLPWDVCASLLVNSCFGRLCVCVLGYCCLLRPQLLGVRWQWPVSTLTWGSCRVVALHPSDQVLRCPLQTSQELHEWAEVVHEWEWGQIWHD